jgi:hypothetical protein
MPALEKATLLEIKADGSAAPIPGTEIDVQFNPQSLKLSLSNKIEGGDTRGRQKRQYLGKTSTTLSFDLHFDTADEGTDEEPVSVRTRTAAVERFVLPKGQGNQKQAPPKVRFHWDQLVIDGIIEDVAIDFDLFAANGAPLRAKIGVSIKEQDAKYELLHSGPGANQPDNAAAPGGGGAGPGSNARGATDTTATALGGESAADFAARLGLDPGAWRGIAAQLGASSSLTLKAGVEIDFSSSLSAGAGIGVSAGLEAGADLSLEAAFGLNASASGGASPSLGSSAGVQAGFALSTAGGLGAALETVASIQAGTAAAQTRNAFGSAAPLQSNYPATSIGTTSVGPRRAAPTSTAASPQSNVLVPATVSAPLRPIQPRSPLRLTGLPSPSAQAAAPTAPPPPAADPRATSFGFGVPLRPRVSGAADLRTAWLGGVTVLKPRARATDVITPDSPIAPPWTRLPPSDAARVSADKVQMRRGPSRLACGCIPGCQGGSLCGCRASRIHGGIP